MTDETLLLKQLKDPRTREQAFTLMVQTYQESLYILVRGILKSHADTDDVLQNAFIKAWGAIDTFRGESRLGTWLYSIARNEALTFQSKRARAIDTQSDAGEAVNKVEGDPYMDGDATERMLQMAIEQLPLKQREVFTMRYFNETPYEEMSELTGTSIGALKASYHFAVKKITAFFQQND